MLYRKFGKTNEMVSILGFGCMRLPLLPGGDPSKIDEELATKLIRFAIDEGVNIPECFTLYNNYYMFGREETYNLFFPPKQRASNCIECNQCETLCPQSIMISQELKNVKAVFEPA